VESLALRPVSIAQAAMVARPPVGAPAAAASSRMRSVSARITAGSLRVQRAIVKARESVTSPAASAAASSGRSVSWRIGRTAALPGSIRGPDGHRDLVKQGGGRCEAALVGGR
jgi:hypothetical protein